MTREQKLPRRGWVLSGVQQPESVADHMHRAAMCAFLIDDPTVNRDKCIKMCLVHDLAESIIGDITPHCGVSKEEKKKVEREAMKKLSGMLSPKIGDELLALFDEYECGETPEAIYCRDIDAFEMILQAREYEQGNSRNRHATQNNQST